MNYKCKICGRKLGGVAGVKIHLNKNHFTNKIEIEVLFMEIVYGYNESELKQIVNNYLDGLTINEIVKKYNGCNISNYLNLLKIKRTNSESKKTKKYVEKHKGVIQKKYGVDNISQSKLIKEKKKKTFLKNYGYENNFCNKEIGNLARDKINYNGLGDKLKKIFLEKYGVENASQLEHVKKIIGEKAKIRMSKLSLDERRKYTEKARQNVNYESKIQLRVQDIINELSLTYTANAFLYAYNFDFLFKGKIILEIQGDFWHGNPNKYKKDDVLLGKLTAEAIWKKDERKKNIVEKNGYKIFYLWEYEINKMTNLDIINYLKKILL